MVVVRTTKLRPHSVDWPTPNGTGKRDSIHTMHLVEGLPAAPDNLLAEAQQLLTNNPSSCQDQNVLEVARGVEPASGGSIPRAITALRPGDAYISNAYPSKPVMSLGWQTQPTSAETAEPGSSRTPRDMREPANGLPT